MSEITEHNTTQKRGIRSTVAVLFVFAALLTGGFALRIVLPQPLTDGELKANGAFVYPNPRLVEEFSLLDDTGAVFTKSDLSGRWSLLFFGFTSCPDICPTTLATLARLLEQLDPEVRADTQVILVSVDPARDTPEKLHDYVKYFNASYRGVTGEFMALRKFADNLHMPFKKEPGGGDNYSVAHSANIAVVNPRGDYVAHLRPPFKVEQLLLTYNSIRLIAN